MGYRVEYSCTGKYPKSEKQVKSHLFFLVVILFVLFLAGVNRYWPDGTEVLERLTTFEQWEFTKLAMEEMVQNLKHGLSIAEAVTVFCRDIVQYGLEYAA